MSQPVARKASVSHTDVDDTNTPLLVAQIQSWLNEHILARHNTQQGLDATQRQILSALSSNVMLHKHLASTPALRSILTHCIRHCRSRADCDRIRTVLRQYDAQQQYTAKQQQIQQLKHRQQQLQQQLNSSRALLIQAQCTVPETCNSVLTNDPATSMQHHQQQYTVQQGYRYQLQQQLTALQGFAHSVQSACSSAADTRQQFGQLLQDGEEQCQRIGAMKREQTTASSVQLYAHQLMQQLEAECAERSVASEQMLNEAAALQDKIEQLVQLHAISPNSVQALQQRCISAQIDTVKQIQSRWILEVNKYELLVAELHKRDTEHAAERLRHAEQEQQIADDLKPCKTLVTALLLRQQQCMQYVEEHMIPLLQQCDVTLQRCQQTVQSQRRTVIDDLSPQHSAAATHDNGSQQPPYVAHDNMFLPLSTALQHCHQAVQAEQLQRLTDDLHNVQRTIPDTETLHQNCVAVQAAYSEMEHTHVSQGEHILDNMLQTSIPELRHIAHHRLHQPALTAAISG